MDLLDLNRDGKISPEELEQVGLDGLPNFSALGADGHHYDVESGKFFDNVFRRIIVTLNSLEFFLHHEGNRVIDLFWIQFLLSKQRNSIQHQKHRQMNHTLTQKI